MSPSCLCPTHSEANRVISTFLFDPNLKPSPQNLHREEASGPPKPIERLGHLLGGGLRSSGMPHEGYADPIMNDGPRFHSNIIFIELTKRVARAIKASDVSSTPPAVETVDGVIHETQPTPTEPNGARGFGPPNPDSGV